MSRDGKQERHFGSSRRRFLQSAAASTSSLLLANSLFAAPPPSQQKVQLTSGTGTTISEHLQVYHGPIHVGIVRHDNRALIIDCGDGSVRQTLDQSGITHIEQLLFTHYHRDQLCGVEQFPVTAQRGAPAKERTLFSNPMEYWNDDQHLYRVYRSFRPDHLTPLDPVRVDKSLSGGDQFTFGTATIHVLDTPGHTPGSISYLVDVDGKRVLFCGDLIAGSGNIWELYSLQAGFQRGEQSVGGYHGFMGDRWQLAESLETARHAKPDTIVPSHGNLITDAGQAIDDLLERLEAVYENYVSISALRFYFPQLFDEYADKPGQMPIRAGRKPPDCLRHFGTTWMLVSQTGAALPMDVGSRATVDRLKKMLSDGEISSIDGLWVTHYHYDHTDGIPAFQAEFDCPCMTDQRLANVLVNPAAWRLPCLAPEPIRVHRPMRDGQSWEWHEFKLTSFFFPGQTLYHAALLAERGDTRMLFVGDSFTPGGLDDYCAHNRNLLGQNVGFHYCLSLIEKLEPTHMFNCHVDEAFMFTAEEIAFMRRQLDEREKLFGQLTPWPHANFATDPSWVRVAPYRQQLQAGQTTHLEIVVTNHAQSGTSCSCRAALPKAWGGAKTAWASRQVAGEAERGLQVALTVPHDAKAARYVVAIDVRLGETELPCFTECIVDVIE